MINNEGKRICDKEIRNRAGMWCGCRRPAIIKVASKIVSYMEVDYCARHVPRLEIVKKRLLARNKCDSALYTTAELP